MTTRSDKLSFSMLFNMLTKPLVFLANLTRHLILLLIFILLMWLIFGGQKISLKPKTALVIAPKGFVVEQFSGDPTSQALQKIQDNEIPETRMRDLLKVIDAAATDDGATDASAPAEDAAAAAHASAAAAEATSDSIAESVTAPVASPP